MCGKEGGKGKKAMVLMIGRQVLVPVCYPRRFIPVETLHARFSSINDGYSEDVDRLFHWLSEMRYSLPFHLIEQKIEEIHSLLVLTLSCLP